MPEMYTWTLTCRTYLLIAFESFPNLAQGEALGSHEFYKYSSVKSNVKNQEKKGHRKLEC